MSRPTPHKRRPAGTTPAHATNESIGMAAPLDDGWQRTLDITRTMLGASLSASKEWMHGLGELQQAQATALRHAGESIDEIASQAEHAPDWPSLWALQASVAGTHWTRAMQDCSDFIDQAMQVEARLVEQSRADATRLSQQWLGELSGRDEAATHEAADETAPLTMFTQAQATMNEMSRLWTQALYNTTLPD